METKIFLIGVNKTENFSQKFEEKKRQKDEATRSWSFIFFFFDDN
jgi:hypothetical protein